VSTSVEDRSAAELVKQLAEQTTTLARQEIRLAQLELQEKGRRAGIGAGAFGAAGIIALYAVGAVIAGSIILLATALAAWLAAIVIGAALALIAGAVALFGKRQIDEATPPAPQQAIASVKRDVDVVKGARR
jgi:putative superfamily III holin-X